jgi:anti-anti-sigma factor
MSGCASDVISGDAGRPAEPAVARPGGLLSLGCQVTARGEVVVTLAGELDLASAEQAFGYVRDVIDQHNGPVLLDLASVSFCDARGLGTLVRMGRYAGQAGRVLTLMSPRPQLLKIMRITGVNDALPVDLRCLDGRSPRAC